MPFLSPRACSDTLPKLLRTSRVAKMSLFSFADAMTLSNTGILYFCATTFTGEGVNIIFLPTGLSGWVTTRAISIPRDLSNIIFSRRVAEKEGVPKYAIFMMSFYHFQTFFEKRKEGLFHTKHNGKIVVRITQGKDIKRVHFLDRYHLFLKKDGLRRGGSLSYGRLFLAFKRNLDRSRVLKHSAFGSFLHGGKRGGKEKLDSTGRVFICFKS